MSNETKATGKGRVTIPKEIRDSLSMKAGDRLTFTLTPDSTVIIRVKKKNVTGFAGGSQKKK